MRAAVGGFFHETNTFCAIRTDLDSFKARDYIDADDVKEFTEYFNDAREITGFLRTLAKYNDDVATNLLPKIYVMTVVKDSELKLIMNDIYNEIGTGTHGDGKVFVSNIEDAMRIRTGECGENAL